MFLMQKHEKSDEKKGKKTSQKRFCSSRKISTQFWESPNTGCFLLCFKRKMIKLREKLENKNLSVVFRTF
jgi:hypothetical protein